MHIVLLENKLGICSRKTLGTKRIWRQLGCSLSVGVINKI